MAIKYILINFINVRKCYIVYSVTMRRISILGKICIVEKYVLFGISYLGVSKISILDLFIMLLMVRIVSFVLNSILGIIVSSINIIGRNITIW